MALSSLKSQLLTFLFFLSLIGFSQQKQKITIEYAGIAYTDPKIEEGDKVDQ